MNFAADPPLRAGTNRENRLGMHLIQGTCRGCYLITYQLAASSKTSSSPGIQSGAHLFVCFFWQADTDGPRVCSSNAGNDPPYELAGGLRNMDNSLRLADGSSGGTVIRGFGVWPALQSFIPPLWPRSKLVVHRAICQDSSKLLAEHMQMDLRISESGIQVQMLGDILLIASLC